MDLEMEKWRNMWEPRQYKTGQRTPVEAQAESNGCKKKHSYWSTKKLMTGSWQGVKAAASECLNHCSIDGNDDPGPSVDELMRLQDWVQFETKKYTILEQRRHAEIEAFTEQMRLKDQKLEAYRW